MEKSGLFNSVNGDRKYKAEDFANYFNKFITNGVFPSPSTNLQVMAGDGMNVVVKAGSAWINGYAYDNTTDLILPVDPADGVLNRIDRVVLRYDTINREIKAKIKKGTFASVPMAPAIQRDANAFELALADISIAKGIVSISQAYITDTRLNTSFCGIVNSLIQVDTTTLLNQYEASMQDKEAQFTQDFNDWFATIQAALDGDTAGNLLNLITNHKSDKNNPHGVTPAQIGAAKQSDFTSHLADYVRQPGYGVTSGTSTAYTITLNPAPTAYEDGQQFIITPNADCGANPTLNINGLGAGAIVKQDGSAILSGDIKANKPLSLVRVGSSFFIRSSGGGKKSSKGMVTSNSTSQNFTLVSGVVQSFACVTVSGLDFKPSKITIKYNNGSVFMTEYDEMNGDLYAKTIKLIQGVGTGVSSINVYNVKGDVNSANVVYGGFTLPVVSGLSVPNYYEATE